MKNEREQIIQRLKEYTQVSGSSSLVDLLMDTMDDRYQACTRLQVKLNDIEEENEGIRRELAESKISVKWQNQIEELQAKVIELESELDARNAEFLDLIQLGPADRYDFVAQLRSNIASLIEKDVSLF